MNVLVVDDNAGVRDTIEVVIRPEHTVFKAGSVSEATVLLSKQNIDLAITDLRLGEGKPTGIDFLKIFKRKYPDRPAVIESGNTDLDIVVQCMKLGADDYVQKPFTAQCLQLKVAKAISDTQRNRVLSREFEKSSQEIIGNHPELLAAKEAVENAGMLTILFCGETGVGKTQFARYASKLASTATKQVRPFEQVNCASLNSQHFEDVLFGHKKGAFTGVTSDKMGLVELADGGDLFLDEIGDMPLDIQVQFHTFLDNLEYRRMGDDKKRIANVRILAATNRDLDQMVKAGAFRPELLSRISKVVVNIPPLRERMSDIPILFDHFVDKFAGHGRDYSPDKN